MRHLKITLTDEQYERIAKAAGREPMAAYARRAVLAWAGNDADDAAREKHQAQKISETEKAGEAGWTPSPSHGPDGSTIHVEPVRSFPKGGKKGKFL